ncbi:MAG: CHAT domain-containing protein, partial [Mangrovimonas sp.]|nr:CHAT domain-containing protein [Mangrovimonas sp.]
HAFNYAGSESILTSLWKIDEQSSATILTSFYDYLAQGLSKDKALQLAKLDYLSQAKGRTLEPQYWAGMILMGNTAPIDMQTAQTPWLWILGFLVFAVLVGYIVIKRKRAI